MKSRKLFVFLVIIIHLCLHQVFSQNSDDILVSIVVTNSNNELIPNVSAKLFKEGQEYQSVKTETSLKIVFQNVKTGEYLLELKADGYEPLSTKIKISSENRNFAVQLDLAGIKETVEVKKDENSLLIDNAFTTFFTKEQIEALPEKGEEIERELKRRYGADVIIKVDGFNDRVPDKSRIASIRATQSSYDAENHELGFTFVEITTKVGEESFGGTFLYDFNDSALNARLPLSKIKLPDSTNNFTFSLFGPIIQKKTAFDFNLSQSNLNRKNNIIAILPNGQAPSEVSSKEKGIYINPTIYHNLSENHNLKLNYTFENALKTNQGVGGFDLPERAFSTRFNSHRITLSESGYFKNKFFNEFRLFYKHNQRDNLAENDTPTIKVLDTFNSGGSGNNSKNTDSSFWVANNFLFGYKSHSLKVGGQLEFQNSQESSRINERGTFVFSSLDDYVNNKPALFTQTPTLRSSNVKIIRTGVFIQDDFKAKKNLGISLGLRYEVQNKITDLNNFSPRFGFTWVPPRLKKTVVRGGIGIFYNWIELSTFNYLENRGLSQPNEIIIKNPTFSTLQPIPTQNTIILSYWKLGENVRNASIFHSSVGINNNLGKTSQLRINYVFQKATNLLRSRNTNLPENGIRPNPMFSNIFQLESTGLYTLNKMEIAFSSILKKAISYGLNYTLQKKISDSEGVFSFPSNNFNLKDDLSFSDDDQRHSFSGSINWKVKKGILLSSIYRVESSLPYTITTGFDNNEDSIFNDRPFGVKRNSERGTWRKQVDIGLSYTKSFWNYKKDRKGKVQIIYSRKEIARDNETIEDRKRFQLRLYTSIFNLFNSSNFKSFVGVQTSPLFGKPISANTSRRIDMGLRFGF